MADKSKALTFGSGCKASIGGTTMLVTNQTLKNVQEWHEPSDVGLVGTVDPGKDGRQVSKQDVNGAITVLPSYANAYALLQEYFDEATGAVLTPADDPTVMLADVVVDFNRDVYTYADCWLNTLTLAARENEPVAWTLDLMGSTEADSGSVAALTPPDRMWLSDLTMSINSNNYFPTGFSWSFSYDLVERYMNSQTRLAVGSRIRRCMLDLSLDLNADTFADLFDNAGANTAIADVIMTFTDGSNTLTITHPEMTVVGPSKTGDISGVDDITWDLSLRAWKKSGEDDLVNLVYA